MLAAMQAFLRASDGQPSVRDRVGQSVPLCRVGQLVVTGTRLQALQLRQLIAEAEQLVCLLLTLALDACFLLGLRRVRGTAKTTGTTTATYTWDINTGIPLLLTDGTTSYLYGPGGLPIEQISSAGTPTYLMHDQIGSTRLLTSATGTVTATYSYDAYGNTTSHTGTATTPFLCAGQYQDTETGFYYLRNRYYDPATAQFLTIDPTVAQTQAPYYYASDTPLNLTDPTGLGCNWWNPICAIGELGIAAHWAWFGYQWDQQATGQWLEQQWYAFDASLCSPANQVALGVLFGGEDFGGGDETLPGGEGVLNLSAEDSWGNLSTLEDHFLRHGAEFGATSAEEYAADASEFLQQALKDGDPVKIDANGVIRVYDPETNTFGPTIRTERRERSLNRPPVPRTGPPNLGRHPELYNDVMSYQCPVCGFPDLFEPPRSLRTGGGSYEICPSCGFEFGISDDDLGYSYEVWRQEWIGRGMHWSSVARGRPDGWDPVRQLSSL